MAEEKKQIEQPKIYGAIAGVIADVGAVAKDKVNKQQGFKYRSVDDVFNALHPALAKNKVFIVPRIIEQNREVVGTTKNGTKMTLAICKIKFTFYAEDGSYIEAVIIGEGLDTGDKATNKAMAVAYKYVCFQVFCIPTEEMTDPDSERPELDGAEDEKDKEKKAERKSSSTAEKNETNKKTPSVESEENTKITEAMLNTIRSEQKRTGVSDKVILSRKEVNAKSIEEMTVGEFNRVMKIFERTPDLERGE